MKLQLNPNATPNRILVALDNLYKEVESRIEFFNEAKKENQENDPSNLERIFVYEGFILACKSFLLDLETLN